MARTALSLSADRIRIEDEVWEEAFSSRVRSRPVRVLDSGPRPVQTAEPLSVAPVATAEPVLSVAAPPAEPARRTVRIQGRGAERNLPVSQPTRRTPVAHHRVGSSPDRLAMWAVLLGFLLVLVAVLSSHF